MSNFANKTGRPSKQPNRPFTDVFRDLIQNATQQEVADKVGVSRQNIGKWLSGITAPDIDTLCKIADAYNVSTDYLLGRTTTKSPEPTLQAACEYIGLSEEAIKNFSYLQKPEYNNDIDKIKLWELTDIFLSEKWDNISDSAFSLFMQILCSYVTISYSENENNSHIKNEMLDYQKWRASRTFEKLLDGLTNRIMERLKPDNE